MDCGGNSDLVGIDEQSSAKLKATHWIKAIAIIHPQTIPRMEIDVSPIFYDKRRQHYLKKKKSNTPAVPA
jgi:hypothetical protein